MPQKINWNLFWKESSVLITHTLVAGFYLKIAQVLFDYYRVPLLSAVSLTMSLFFALPLLINFLDLWARTVLAVREDAIAEKMLKASIAIHEKLFGSKNAFMSEKQAMLASLYFDTGRISQAEALFKESLQKYRKAAFKLPRMHACFADYIKILGTTGDTGTTAEVQAALKASHRFRIAQNLGTMLVTVPIICLILSNRATERSIAVHNADGQVVLALEELTTLARREAFFLGEYAAAKVYSEYAQAFDGTTGQLDEMEWSVDKAMLSLKRSGRKDEYMQVLLLNLKAKANLSGGKSVEGMKCLQEAVSLSIKWSEDLLQKDNYAAGIERNKAILSLAELERNQGRYEQAEGLYKKVLDISGNKSEFQTLKMTFLNPVETIDQLHRLQHVELKLGKKGEALKAQEEVCRILEDIVKRLSSDNRNSSVCDFGVREASRELDVCAFMLQDAGRDKEAKDYQSRSELLRNSHRKSLKLDAQQQDAIVDTTTKVTNDLLSVKYRAGDWQKSLSHLLNDELKSKKARGAFEHLPWYDASNAKMASSGKFAKPEKTFTVDIAPLSIRSNREGDGIAVDVQGTVEIFNSKSQSEDEQKFGFAYILKTQNSGRPSVEDLLDNQPPAHISRWQSGEHI